MSGWRGSKRRSELPADWQALRRRILRRDNHQCQWEYETKQKCLGEAREVDHIRRGGDHNEANLRALCSYHHQKKSSSEGNQVTAAQRRVIKTKFRRTEGHPGLL